MKSNAPEVSILLGTYNPDISYLESSVKSIVNQTFTDWELLILDDGSDMDVARQIHKMKYLDPRIRCIRIKHHRGLAAVLNSGLKIARGRYIARMDDDDVSLPQRLQKETDFLKTHPAYGWVGCCALLFDEDGVWGKADRPQKPDEKSFLHSSPYIHPSVLFRGAVLKKNHGYNTAPACARCEDYELFMRLHAGHYRGYNLQEVLFEYREDRNNLHRSFRYCLYEMLIRRKWFSRLQILSLSTVYYVYKPLFVWLMTLFAPGAAQKIRISRNVRDHLQTRAPRHE